MKTLKLLMLLVTFTMYGQYAENFNSRLPGFMSGVQFIDKDFNGFAPGFDYAMGKQPDSNWLNAQERKGLLTRGLS